MPRTDGTMLVRITLRSETMLGRQTSVTVVVPDYHEVRARVKRAGSYRISERVADWYDALTPHGKIVSVDLTEVVLLEEVEELVEA